MSEHKLGLLGIGGGMRSTECHSSFYLRMLHDLRLCLSKEVHKIIQTRFVCRS